MVIFLIVFTYKLYYSRMQVQEMQQELRRAFPEFTSKQKLIDYFVSFDFPEKQMKMVGWWQRVIEFIIQHSRTTYITYQQLLAYLNFFNLKPTPLQPIILFLNKQNVLVPEHQISKMKEKEKEQTGKSWLGTFLPFLSKGEKEKPAFSFTPAEKIFSKKIKELKKQQIKTFLPSLFSEHRSIDRFQLIRQLQERCQLDHASLQETLGQLQLEGVLAIRQRGQKNFVLFSPNSKDFLDAQWSELEGMKFCLREEILRFEAMIAKEEEKASKLHIKAREQASLSNKAGAKLTLKQYVQREKKISAISTRKNVLENQLTQLEYNQLNKSTLILLQESQKVYQQTIVDASRLDQLIDKAAEQSENSKQINEKFEIIGKEGAQRLEEDVDEMLEALSREVQADQKAKIEKKQVQVETKPIQQHQPMQIEHPHETN